MGMKNDKWFLKGCEFAASNSKCLSRKIGALIVRDGKIISTGYNGPATGIPHCKDRFDINLSERKVDDELINAVLEKSIEKGIDFQKLLKFARTSNKCPRQVLGYKSGEGLHLCIAGHAERNAIVNAAYLGVKCKGALMYMNCPVPCTPCLIEIINAGISEIIITNMTHYDSMSSWHLANSDLKVRLFNA